MCVHPDTLQVPFPGTDTEKKMVKPADAYEYIEGIILLRKNLK